MKKLRLRLEHLEVESFSSTPAPEERGTVHGHYPTQDTCEGPECFTGWPYTCRNTEGEVTCNGEAECGDSSLGTCYEETVCFHCTG